MMKQVNPKYTCQGISIYGCTVVAVLGLFSAELRSQPFAARAWDTTGGLNAGRAVHTATLLRNGHVLVVGGFGSPTSAELYDPNSGTWIVTGGLQLGRIQDHTATLLPHGRVLVAAGLGCEPGNWFAPK